MTRNHCQMIKLINLDEVRCAKSRLNCTPFFFNKPDELPNVQFNFYLKAQSVRDSNYEPGLAHQQTISMRSNVREWTHVLLVNTPCSHLHGFGSTGVSSGLATRVTLTRVSRGRLGESISWGWICFWFHVCTVVRDCFMVAFKVVCPIYKPDRENYTSTSFLICGLKPCIVP
jgi:hypothetical protein